MTRTCAVLIGMAMLTGLSGCAGFNSVQDQQQASAPQITVMPGELEPIKAAAVVNNLTVFWVTSNGCTTRDSLLPVVTTQGDASTVTLRRISEDLCKQPSDDGVEVRWSFEELGLKPGSKVTVNNPYQLSPS